MAPEHGRPLGLQENPYASPEDLTALYGGRLVAASIQGHYKI